MKKGEILLGGYLFQNVKLNLSGAYKRFWFTDDYYFSGPDPMTFATADEFDVAETSAEIVWNIREKVMLLQDRRVSLGTKFPRIAIKYTKGWQNWFEGNYYYQRLNLDITQSFSIRGVGKLNLKNSWAATLGEVPITLLQSPTATGGNWNLSVANTFETMYSGEFFADRQVNLFARFTFLQWHTNTKLFQPQLSIHGAAGIGELSNRTSHYNFAFKTYEKGYYETGLILDHILSFNFYGIGLGAFYRIGEYQFSDNSANFTIKMSVRFSL